MKTPSSPFDTLHGLSYLPRMLDKIRLRQAGELDEGYQPQLGGGFDGRLCRYMEIEYKDVCEKVEAGVSDEEVYQWLRELGKFPNEERVFIWNEFIRKRGVDDDAVELLAKMKEKWGLSDRKDIVSILQFIEVDEGRPS